MTTLFANSCRVKSRLRASVETELIVDNFAGAGGASLGIEAATGRAVDIAINHSRRAVEIHSVNHPNTRHLCEDVWDVDPLEVCHGRPVGLAWFSPDCKHFSKAKGGKPLNKRIRGLAWVVIRWAKLPKGLRPKIIILENVSEFQTWGPLNSDGRPIKAKAGQTYLRWLAQLRNLGYEVETRELVAADYGVPTTRKRFFLVARCDGLPIRWPKQTHARRDKAEALGLKPWVPAADCIDFDLPCPSIFERKRPLAPATERRIYRGIEKYVINAADPFIVRCSHGEGSGKTARWGLPVHGIDQPLPTQTASKDFALVNAFLQRFKYGEAEHVDPRKPMQTICAGGNNHAVVAATLMTNTSGHASTDLENPVPTLTSGEQQAVIGATLIQTGYGEKAGQKPRVPGLEKPLGTVVGGGQKHAVVSASLIGAGGPGYAGKPADVQQPINTIMTENHRALVSASLIGVGGRAGQSPPCGVNEPVRTVTAKGDRAVAAAFLSKFYGTGTGQQAQQPMPTITAGSGHGNTHIAEVRAFLVKYYGNGGQDQDARSPMHTLTAKARLGLITVAGEDYQICDIGLRMLKPHELLRAQFGRFADEYILTGTQAQQVAAIGNSVPPELAEAIVRANWPAGSEAER